MAYARGILDIDEYEAKAKKVRARKDELERGRALALKQLTAAAELETKKQALKQRLDELRLEGINEKLPFERKRRILELLVEEIRLDTVEERLEIHGVVRAGVTLADGPGGEGSSPFDFTSVGRSGNKLSTVEVPFALGASVSLTLQPPDRRPSGVEASCQTCGAAFRIHPSHVGRVVRCPEHRRSICKSEAL